MQESQPKETKIVTPQSKVVSAPVKILPLSTKVVHQTK
jgi:hypothetical protein